MASLRAPLSIGFDRHVDLSATGFSVWLLGAHDGNSAPEALFGMQRSQGTLPGSLKICVDRNLVVSLPLRSRMKKEPFSAPLLGPKSTTINTEAKQRSTRQETESNQETQMPETTVKTTKPETRKEESKRAPGLQFRRLFTKSGVSPYDEIEWELRTAQITDAKGNVILRNRCPPARVPCRRDHSRLGDEGRLFPFQRRCCRLP
jgi:hypothetical protein